MDMLITIAYPHSIHSGAAKAKKKQIYNKKTVREKQRFLMENFLDVVIGAYPSLLKNMS